MIPTFLISELFVEPIAKKDIITILFMVISFAATIGVIWIRYRNKHPKKHS